jgi:hypothetical protein
MQLYYFDIYYAVNTCFVSALYNYLPLIDCGWKGLGVLAQGSRKIILQKQAGKTGSLFGAFFAVAPDFLVRHFESRQHDPDRTDRSL